ncbi:DUF6468 domain-containing protein [Aurantimonas manganoxydans]|uniref:DUF6468 domain-containing protein n=1 Tax=Aurantimonas manganoxydans TaxID=651183 RepID=UPI0002E36E6F|nr:DUF6468 domain-containing protein [Aurantimonas manganoxydans]
MISYLLDFVLVVALVVTAFRCTRMQRELRTLRSSESALSASLAQADASITRAAEVVVGLKHEGVETLRRLEFRIAEADDATDRLERLIAEADALPRRVEAGRVHRVLPPAGEWTDRRLHASLAG